MDSLLRHAFIEERCNACGHTYAFTLSDALAEQRAMAEWERPYECEECRVAASPLVDRVPLDVLEALEAAWLEARDAVHAAGFTLSIGEPAGRLAPVR